MKAELANYLNKETELLKALQREKRAKTKNMENNLEDALEDNEALATYLENVSLEDFRHDLKTFIKKSLFKGALDKI
jgi:hypothetical protein